jgi:indole-3-glycerol phosphate synthase
MPKDFLTTIVEHKQAEVEAARAKIPETHLREAAEQPREKRPFTAVLQHPRENTINIIAEIKRASPSKGNIRVDLDPAAYAAMYERGGAAALSVLTEQAFFKGSIDDFQTARENCRLPMLRKDFIVSEYQIFESVVMEADAVLLIARVLSATQLKDYLDLSREMGLDALVEIHSENDLENANQAEAELIGINNRNLQSFDTDLDVAKQLAARLSEHQTPIAASGISGKADIDANLKCGIRTFLIGESLVRSEDPVQLLQTLQGRE